MEKTVKHWFKQFIKAMVVGLAVDAALVLAYLWYVEETSFPSFILGVVLVNIVYFLVSLRNLVRSFLGYFLWRSIGISAAIQSLRKADFPRDVVALDWWTYSAELLQDSEISPELAREVASTNGYLTGLKQGSLSAGISTELLMDQALRRYLS